MIVCTKCGFQNEDSDTFCGSCAGFLEWSGQQVVEEVHHQPEPEPVPSEAEHAGFIDRVKDRIGIGETKDGVEGTNGGEPAAGAAPVGNAAASAAPAAPLLTAPAPPPPTTVAPEVSAAAAPPAPAAKEEAPRGILPAQGRITGPGERPGTADGPALTTPATVARTSQPPPAQPGATPPAATPPSVSAPVQPAAVQPDAVKPTAVKARPTPRSQGAPSRVINPGDLVCGQCGEGNDPARKFCRRCGGSLTEAVVFSLPWYSRLWRKLTTRRTRAAGDRPKLRRRMVGGSGPGWLTSWVTRIIVAAIIIFVVLCFVGPWKHTIRHRLATTYHSALNVVHPTFNAVTPVSATATSSAKGHPPIFIIDGVSNTSWMASAPGTGAGQALLIKLNKPSNIDKIGFLNGDQEVPGAFATEPRPAVLHLFFFGKNPSSKNITLKNSATFQSFTFKVKGATGIKLTVVSVYPSPTGTHVALEEVELFKKS